MNPLSKLTPRLRRRLSTAGALGVAAASITGGAAVSASAMGPDSPPTAESVTVVSADMNGGAPSAIRCTFDGESADALLPQELPASGDQAPVGGPSGTIVPASAADDEPFMTTIEDPAGGGLSGESGESGLVTGEPGATLDSVTVPDGSPEECAALHDEISANIANVGG